MALSRLGAIEAALTAALQSARMELGEAPHAIRLSREKAPPRLLLQAHGHTFVSLPEPCHSKDTLLPLLSCSRACLRAMLRPAVNLLQPLACSCSLQNLGVENCTRWARSCLPPSFLALSSP